MNLQNATALITGGSSGIGLASAFRIVQLLNGSIDFKSEVGRGTTFRIELPLAA